MSARSRNPSARAAERYAAAVREIQRVRNVELQLEQERERVGWFSRGKGPTDPAKRLPKHVVDDIRRRSSELTGAAERARKELNEARRAMLAEDHAVVEAIERLTQKLGFGRGDMAWVPGFEWRERGEQIGQTADLVLLVEGSDWYGILNDHYEGREAKKAYEAFWDAIEKSGYRGEMLHGWSVGLWEGQEARRLPEPIRPELQLLMHKTTRRGGRYEANPRDEPMHNPDRRGNPDEETIQDAADRARGLPHIYKDDPPGERNEGGERTHKMVDGATQAALGFAPATAVIEVRDDRDDLIAELRAFTFYCDDEQVPHPSAIRWVRESYPGYRISYMPPGRYHKAEFDAIAGGG